MHGASGEEGAKDKKKEGQSSTSSLGKKQRTVALQGNQGGGYGYQGQGQSSQDKGNFKATYQTNQKICFYCHQPDHMKRECPQRKRS